MEVMRLGLLVCDHVRPEFLGIAGDYDDMFRRLFAGHDVEIVVYDAIGGELPGDPAECDAWITTGSRYSVNDDEPWIRDLEVFVRNVAAAEVPFVGICFGHQLIAKALGGSVIRSERGWGVGVKEVEVRDDLGLGGPYRVLNGHQDQVETLPLGGEVLGWNEHCPVSMLGVGGTMLGIQGHPEFEASYTKAVMESRRGTEIPDATVAAGIATLSQPTDGDRFADWIVRWLRSGAIDESEDRA
ncbi:MAG: type 1 glutamine amidotransferase [Acidimicrobiia bacterium]